MGSDLDEIREVRGWLKLIQKQENIKKIEAFTSTLNNLQQAFSALNIEMKMFNENITKSNEFLDRIASLQKSMEEQTRAANKFTWAVIGLALLQVILTIIQILAK